MSVSLEARVDALARDIASLRAEMRGWAVVAMAANLKADRNLELLRLIHRDLQEMKAMLRPDAASLGSVDALGSAGRGRILCRGDGLPGDE